MGRVMCQAADVPIIIKLLVMLLKKRRGRKLVGVELEVGYVRDGSG